MSEALWVDLAIEAAERFKFMATVIAVFTRYLVTSRPIMMTSCYVIWTAFNEHYIGFRQRMVRITAGANK